MEKEKTNTFENKISTKSTINPEITKNNICNTMIFPFLGIRMENINQNINQPPTSSLLSNIQNKDENRNEDSKKDSKESESSVYIYQSSNQNAAESNEVSLGSIICKNDKPNPQKHSKLLLTGDQVSKDANKQMLIQKDSKIKVNCQEKSNAIEVSANDKDNSSNSYNNSNSNENKNEHNLFFPGIFISSLMSNQTQKESKKEKQTEKAQNKIASPNRHSVKNESSSNKDSKGKEGSEDLLFFSNISCNNIEKGSDADSKVKTEKTNLSQEINAKNHLKPVLKDNTKEPCDLKESEHEISNNTLKHFIHIEKSSSNYNSSSKIIVIESPKNKDDSINFQTKDNNKKQTEEMKRKNTLQITSITGKNKPNKNNNINKTGNEDKERLEEADYFNRNENQSKPIEMKQPLIISGNDNIINSKITEKGDFIWNTNNIKVKDGNQGIEKNTNNNPSISKAKPNEKNPKKQKESQAKQTNNNKNKMRNYQNAFIPGFSILYPDYMNYSSKEIGIKKNTSLSSKKNTSECTETKDILTSCFNLKEELSKKNNDIFTNYLNFCSGSSLNHSINDGGNNSEDSLSTFNVLQFLPKDLLSNASFINQRNAPCNSQFSSSRKINESNQSSFINQYLEAPNNIISNFNNSMNQSFCSKQSNKIEETNNLGLRKRRSTKLNSEESQLKNKLFLAQKTNLITPLEKQNDTQQKKQQKENLKDSFIEDINELSEINEVDLMNNNIEDIQLDRNENNISMKNETCKKQSSKKLSNKKLLMILLEETKLRNTEEEIKQPNKIEFENKGEIHELQNEKCKDYFQTENPLSIKHSEFLITGNIIEPNDLKHINNEIFEKQSPSIINSNFQLGFNNKILSCSDNFVKENNELKITNKNNEKAEYYSSLYGKQIDSKGFDGLQLDNDNINYRNSSMQFRNTLNDNVINNINTIKTKEKQVVKDISKEPANPKSNSNSTIKNSNISNNSNIIINSNYSNNNIESNQNPTQFNQPPQQTNINNIILMNNIPGNFTGNLNTKYNFYYQGIGNNVNMGLKTPENGNEYDNGIEQMLNLINNYNYNNFNNNSNNNSNNNLNHLSSQQQNNNTINMNNYSQFGLGSNNNFQDRKSTNLNNKINNNIINSNSTNCFNQEFNLQNLYADSMIGKNTNNQDFKNLQNFNNNMLSNNDSKYYKQTMQNDPSIKNNLIGETNSYGYIGSSSFKVNELTTDINNSEEYYNQFNIKNNNLIGKSSQNASQSGLFTYDSSNNNHIMNNPKTISCNPNTSNYSNYMQNMVNTNNIRLDSQNKQIYNQNSNSELKSNNINNKMILNNNANYPLIQNCFQSKQSGINQQNANYINNPLYNKNQTKDYSQREEKNNVFINQLNNQKITNNSNSNTFNSKCANLLPSNNINNKAINLKNPVFPDVCTSSNINNYNFNFESLNLNSIIKDQNECRQLQSLIDKRPEIAHHILFPQLLQNFIVVCSDPFGNYLAQKIISVLDSEQLLKVRLKIEEQFDYLSIHNFGTRVVQKFIELADPQVISDLEFQLKQSLDKLCRNQNGIHVVSKYVAKSQITDFIYDYLIINIIKITTDKEGCCLIQKVLELDKNKGKRLALINEIVKNCLSIITDKHANYVIQLVILLEIPNINREIFSVICDKKNFTVLCRQKYSSNLIEKCLDWPNKEIHNYITEVIYNNPTCISELLFDQYGNYVILKSLNVFKEPWLSEILSIVGLNLKKLNGCSFGNRLYLKLITNFPQLKDFESFLSNPNNKEDSSQIGYLKNSNFNNNNNSNYPNANYFSNMNIFNQNEAYSDSGNYFNNNKNNFDNNNNTINNNNNPFLGNISNMNNFDYQKNNVGNNYMVNNEYYGDNNKIYNNLSNNSNQNQQLGNFKNITFKQEVSNVPIPFEIVNNSKYQQNTMNMSINPEVINNNCNIVNNNSYNQGNYNMMVNYDGNKLKNNHDNEQESNTFFFPKGPNKESKNKSKKKQSKK